MLIKIPTLPLCQKSRKLFTFNFYFLRLTFTFLRFILSTFYVYRFRFNTIILSFSYQKFIQCRKYGANAHESIKSIILLCSSVNTKEAIIQSRKLDVLFIWLLLLRKINFETKQVFLNKCIMNCTKLSMSKGSPMYTNIFTNHHFSTNKSSFFIF